MTGLDYTELDKWMKDLDVLQQELRSMQQPKSISRLEQCKTNGSAVHQRPLVVNTLEQRPQPLPRHRMNSVPGHQVLDYRQNGRNHRASPTKYPEIATRGLTYTQADYQTVRRIPPQPIPRTCHNIEESCVPGATRIPQSKSFSQFGHHTRAIYEPTVDPYARGASGKEQKTVHWSSDVGNNSTSPVVPEQRHKTVLNIQIADSRSASRQSRQPEPLRPTNLHFPNDRSPSPPRRPGGSIRSQSVGPVPRQHKPSNECPFAFPINLADFAAERNKTDKQTPKTPRTSYSPAEQSPSQWLQSIHETLTPDEHRPPLGPRLSLDGERLFDAVDARYTKTYMQPPDVHDIPNGPGRPNGRTTSHVTVKKKLILRVYHPDKTTKAIAVEQDMTAFDVLKILLEKNMMRCTSKHALVEKIPSLKLERCFEDSERVMDCLINWQLDSENLIFFEEREDMFGMFENPQVWLGDQTVVSNGPIDSNHAKELFVVNNEINVPAHSEHLYVRTNDSHWKRRLCLLRNSGLYVSKHNTKDISAFHRIVSFKPYLHLYTTTGGWKKLQAPTPYGFLIRPYSNGPVDSQYTVYFCATSEASLRVWYSLLRLALAGLQLLKDYEARVYYARKSNLEPLSKSIPSLSASHDRIDMTRYPNQRTSVSPRPFWPDLTDHQANMGSTSTMWSNNTGSTKELGCVSGRTDVHSSTHSVAEWERPCTKKHSADCGHSISSLLSCSPSWSKDGHIPAIKSKPASRSSSVTRPTTTRSLKKRLFGNGPSARRCSRSISNISAPFDVTIPNWVRERCTTRLGRDFIETTM